MKRFIKLFILLIAVGVIAWVIWANTALESNAYIVRETNLPSGFDGFVIAHITDFHSQKRMIKSVIQMLKDAPPDIICITGDLLDSRSKDVDAAIDFARQAAEIAPCYYVTGNHEARVSEDLRNTLLEQLAACGVTLLNDREVILERNGSHISLAGHFWGKTDNVGSISQFDGYRILLSHQPESFDDYAAGNYDLVFTGHTHGGQFCLPFVGGVYAPGQGLFPQYDAGLFSEGSTDMIVSRGIGNSSFPLRFNNRPEVIFAALKCLTPVT